MGYTELTEQFERREKMRGTVAGKCAPDHCGIDPSVHSNCKTEKRYFPHMEESKTCDPDDVVWHDRYCGLPDDILYGSR